MNLKDAIAKARETDLSSCQGLLISGMEALGAIVKEEVKTATQESISANAYALNVLKEFCRYMETCG